VNRNENKLSVSVLEIEISRACLVTWPLAVAMETIADLIGYRKVTHDLYVICIKRVGIALAYSSAFGKASYQFVSPIHFIVRGYFAPVSWWNGASGQCAPQSESRKAR